MEPIGRAIAAHGLRYDELASGLPLSFEQLKDPAEWIDWDVVAELFNRFERATSHSASLEMGRMAVSLETVGPLRRIASLTVNQRLLYRAGLRWQLPLLYRNLQVKVRDGARRRLLVDVVIPSHHRGSAAWLRMLQGGLEVLPGMLGLPPAHIDSDISAHHATYRIQLPHQPWQPLTALRQLFRNPAVNELERQVEELGIIERERQRVDEALREQERMLTNLIANSSGMVYRAESEDGRFEFVSDRCVHLTGYSAQELLSESLSPLALVHADDVERLRMQRKSSLEARQPSSIEYRMRTRSGEIRWVLDVARGLYDEKGSVRGIEGFITDVTESKRLEDVLSHAMRVESVGRLAGGIAHDFNNLLSVIMSSAELAQRVLPKAGPAYEFNQQIITAADRASALTRQLLAFARKQVIEPRVVDLNDLILAMDKLLRRALLEDIELACVLDADLWNVEVDPGQFEQVLLNLALNARDAMPQGGTLTIETANVVIEETSPELLGLSEGPYVLLVVSDTGEGMSDEVQRRAFEPFFTTKETGKGTGLGLASSHGIVRQAHGQIFVSSRPGQGASFRIYLPRSAGEKPEVERKPTQAPRGNLETLLVVEDHEMLREIVVRALQAQGYTVLAAGSGPEALELVARTPGTIDLLLTDVVMPQMSGLHLATRFADTHPDTPVLYMSGYSEQNVLQRHAPRSRAHFFAKPFTPSSLACKVREVLDAQAARWEGRASVRPVRTNQA